MLTIQGLTQIVRGWSNVSDAIRYVVNVEDFNMKNGETAPEQTPGV